MGGGWGKAPPRPATVPAAPAPRGTVRAPPRPAPPGAAGTERARGGREGKAIFPVERAGRGGARTCRPSREAGRGEARAAPRPPGSHAGKGAGRGCREDTGGGGRGTRRAPAHRLTQLCNERGGQDCPAVSAVFWVILSGDPSEEPAEFPRSKGSCSFRAAASQPPPAPARQLAGAGGRCSLRHGGACRCPP